MHFSGVSLVAEWLVDPRRRSSEGFASGESLQMMLARMISNQLENELHDASGEGRSATIATRFSCLAWGRGGLQSCGRHLAGIDSMRPLLRRFGDVGRLANIRCARADRLHAARKVDKEVQSARP